jgi:hypothetical protein
VLGSIAHRESHETYAFRLFCLDGMVRYTGMVYMRCCIAQYPTLSSIESTVHRYRFGSVLEGRHTIAHHSFLVAANCMLIDRLHILLFLRCWAVFSKVLIGGVLLMAHSAWVSLAQSCDMGCDGIYSQCLHCSVFDQHVHCGRRII